MENLKINFKQIGTKFACVEDAKKAIKKGLMVSDLTLVINEKNRLGEGYNYEEKALMASSAKSLKDLFGSNPAELVFFPENWENPNEEGQGYLVLMDGNSRLNGAFSSSWGQDIADNLIACKFDAYFPKCKNEQEFWKEFALRQMKSNSLFKKNVSKGEHILGVLYFLSKGITKKDTIVSKIGQVKLSVYNEAKEIFKLVSDKIGTIANWSLTDQTPLFGQENEKTEIFSNWFKANWRDFQGSWLTQINKFIDLLVTDSNSAKDLAEGKEVKTETLPLSYQTKYDKKTETVAMAFSLPVGEKATGRNLMLSASEESCEIDGLTVKMPLTFGDTTEFSVWIIEGESPDKLHETSVQFEAPKETYKKYNILKDKDTNGYVYVSTKDDKSKYVALSQVVWDNKTQKNVSVETPIFNPFIKDLSEKDKNGMFGLTFWPNTFGQNVRIQAIFLDKNKEVLESISESLEIPNAKPQQIIATCCSEKALKDVLLDLQGAIQQRDFVLASQAIAKLTLKE